MKTIKIAHASDIHYCEKHLEWVHKAMVHFVDHAIAFGAECAILSGDSFDHQVHVHEPAVHAFLGQVRRLADHMPVLVLQGTFSHDRPGSLEVLRTLAGKYPVHVASHLHQVALLGAEWHISEGFTFDRNVEDVLDCLADQVKVVVSCLPSIHKGTVKAMTEGDDSTAADLVEMVCSAWAESNLRARAHGIPTVLVTHGTVNGSVTESKYAMVSPDHEFSPGVLFGAQASAVMVGHIHAHNTWEHEGRQIAYPGSITRLVFGHDEPTYWLAWEVGADRSAFECRPTPARELIDITFEGPPDLEKLRAAAPSCAGAWVRVRWTIDEEYRHQVDAAAIREILAGAADVKLEGRVNPVQRSRADGITRAEKSLGDRLTIWGQVTETKTDQLHDRLADLQIHDVDEIIERYIRRDPHWSNVTLLIEPGDANATA